MRERTKFYADENVEQALVDYLRDNGFHVDFAIELGLTPRDDQFHLQEARRRKAVLLTRDTDFLDNTKFSFDHLKGSAVVVLSTPDTSPEFGWALLNILHDIAKSGTRNLAGLKIEISGRFTKVQARIKGRIVNDVVDFSKNDDRELFV